MATSSLYGLARSGDKESNVSHDYRHSRCFKGAFQGVWQEQNQLIRPLVYWLWLEKQASAQKKIKEMSTHTVMSGHIVRYLVYVRVCYLLLGWWYLTLTVCNHMIMGKPRKKE